MSELSAPQTSKRAVEASTAQFPMVERAVAGCWQRVGDAEPHATIDRSLAHHHHKRAALNDLFQTALHQLMTAQLRVTDLDIDTSEVPAPSSQGVAA